MAKIGRPGLSAGQKAELWERWKGGQCASDIDSSMYPLSSNQSARA
jgi:hypothetical protein